MRFFMRLRVKSVNIECVRPISSPLQQLRPFQALCTVGLAVDYNGVVNGANIQVHAGFMVNIGGDLLVKGRQSWFRGRHFKCRYVVPSSSFLVSAFFEGLSCSSNGACHQV